MCIFKTQKHVCGSGGGGGSSGHIAGPIRTSTPQIIFMLGE